MLLQNDMPNLTHIVTTPAGLDYISPVLSMFGRQLEIIEFLDGRSFPGYFYDAIVSILRRCPKANTLKYNVNYSKFSGANNLLRPSQINIVLHKSLRNIVLQINPRQRGDEALERCLLQHFRVLTGMAFPGLRRVILEGVVDCDAPLQQAYTVMRRRFPEQRIDGKDIVWER
jgi:hypothetical protein